MALFPSSGLFQAIFRNVDFIYFIFYILFTIKTMHKVQQTSGSQCRIPSSKPFRIQDRKCMYKTEVCSDLCILDPPHMVIYHSIHCAHTFDSQLYIYYGMLSLLLAHKLHKLRVCLHWHIVTLVVAVCDFMNMQRNGGGCYFSERSKILHYSECRFH
jgi:hypothetical protein